MQKQNGLFVRILVYLAGILLIAVGINVSKLSGLGISPVSSVPGVLSKITNLSLGAMVVAVYCILVLLQFVVLRSKFRPVSVLGVPIAIVFGLIVDFIGISEFTPTLAGIPLGFDVKIKGLLSFLPKPTVYPLQLLVLLASILLIAVGVYLYLQPKFVPLPAEGLAAAVTEVSKKAFGNCKTAVDVSMITLALVLQFAFLGGFSSFTGDRVVVREGTVLSGILVGQCVKLIKRLAESVKPKKAQDSKGAV